MSLVLITPPEVEPVTLAMAKMQIRQSSTVDDDLIKGMIAAARQEAETLTQTSIMEQTWELTIDGLELGRPSIMPSLSVDLVSYDLSVSIPLRRGPVRSVESVKYLDSEGDLQTVDEDAYQLVTGNPARIVPVSGGAWPSVQSMPGAFRIRYVAGYEDASEVPQAIKQWILLRIGSYERFREDVFSGIGQVQTLPFADRMLDAFREF